TRWKGVRTLQVTSPRGVFDVSANAVLLSTGCRERPRAARLVPGSRPAGVLTTGSLQRLLRAGAPVGRRAVVVGAETISFWATQQLVRAGVEVVAMTTELREHQASRLVAWLLAGRRGVPILGD